MPFDGRGFESEPAPLPLRLLDRTRELLQTDDQWIKGTYRRMEDGTVRRCLYGALLAAERELVSGQVNQQDIWFKDGVMPLRPRSHAFMMVHHALNRVARPRLMFWRFLYQAWAMDANDAHTTSLTDLHQIIAKARIRLVRQMQHI